MEKNMNNNNNSNENSSNSYVMADGRRQKLIPCCNAQDETGSNKHIKGKKANQVCIEIKGIQM